MGRVFNCKYNPKRNVLAFTFTAISIAFGFILGETILNLFAEKSSSTLKAFDYNGPFEHWYPKNAMDTSKVIPTLPVGRASFFKNILTS
eukprot:Awhi_evm2s155